MAKKKSNKEAFSIKPWCWYCLKELDDERVLLQHQKAKHFKCTHCPRKLNTAGGLMVHCQQVHKMEPDRLTNCLPGRDGYDVEIFGMEGVPQKDLDEWSAKKREEAGVALDNLRSQNANRPKVYHGIISAEELAAQLTRHKQLMSGAVNGIPMGMGMGMMPQGMMPPSGAFPPFGFPQGMHQMGMPNGAPPFLPPNFQNGAPNQFRPPFLPPNGMLPPFPPQAGGFRPMPGMPGFAGMMPPQSMGGMAPPAPVVVLPPKDGTMWPDNESSPAEKRALQSRYRYTSPVLAPAIPFGMIPPNFLPPGSFRPPFPPASASPVSSAVSPSPSHPLVGSNVAPEPPSNPILPPVANIPAIAEAIPEPGTIYATSVKPDPEPEPVPQQQEDIDGTVAHQEKMEGVLDETTEVDGGKETEAAAATPLVTGSRKRKAAEDFMD